MKSNKNHSSNVLWGELAPRESFKQEVITPDIIENVWRQVMDETAIDCDYSMDKQPEYIELPIGDLRVLNIIDLHRQLREMASGTPPPLRYGSTARRTDAYQPSTLKNPLNFSSSQGKRGTPGERPAEDINLTHVTAHEILRHTIIVLLAHIGFEKSSDIAIKTLTDIAGQFLRRMSLLLKAAAERDEHGFPDAVERTLLETGVGGVIALHDYYQEFIVNYHKKLERNVEKLVEEQRRCERDSSALRMELDEAAGKLHFEELDEFGNVYRDVPTLQLLDPEMSLTPSLDAGFQMLHSLEQDQLHNAGNEDEDINISDLPNTGTRSQVSADRKRIVMRKSYRCTS